MHLGKNKLIFQSNDSNKNLFKEEDTVFAVRMNTS